MRTPFFIRVNLVLFLMVSVFLSIATSVGKAATYGISQNRVSVSVLQWGASAVPRGMSSGQGPLVMAWDISRGVAYQYFDIINVGQTDLSSQSFLVTNTSDKSGNAKAPTVTFEACVGDTWSPTTHLCSGQVVTMGSTTTEFFTSLSTPLSVGQRLSARARTSPSGSSSYTTTINVLIDRTQIRGPVTTNS